MRGEKRVAQLAELAVHPLAGRVLLPVLPHPQPHALDRMDDEEVAHFLAGRERRVQPREVILQLRPMRPPGRLLADRTGEVALGLSQHRVPVEVRAAQVDPEGHLPVAERLEPGEGEVPAGAAVGLGQAPLPAELPRGGADLLGGVVDAAALGQHVNPRRLHVFVEPHAGRRGRDLLREAVLFENVPGVLQPVASAPLADLLRIRSHEKVADAVVEVVARGPDALAFEVVGELRQVRQQVVAVALPEDFRQRAGPGQRTGSAGLCADGWDEALSAVRLVAEDARDEFSERPAAFAAIGFVRHADELSHRGGVERVNVGIAVVPIVRLGEAHFEHEDLLSLRQPPNSLTLWDRPHRERCIPLDDRGERREHVGRPAERRRVVALDEAQHPLAPGGMLRHQSAGRAGRPAVFIVEPGFHLQFLRLVHAGVNTLEPARRQIRCDEADARVHEEPAHAHPAHHADLPAQFLRLKVPVPRPERFAAPG